MSLELCLTLPTKLQFDCGKVNPNEIKDPEKHCTLQSTKTNTYTFCSKSCKNSDDCQNIKWQTASGPFKCSTLQDEPFDIWLTNKPVVNDMKNAYQEYVKQQVMDMVKVQPVAGISSSQSGVCLPIMLRSPSIETHFKNYVPQWNDVQTLYIPKGYK